MKQIIRSSWLLTLGFTALTTYGQEWKPVANTLMTQWAEKVDPAAPLPEYPRPQMVRKDWVNLNGLWDYAITPKDDARPTKFDGKILVPFCIESALSGVKQPLTPEQRLWYRRTFAAPDLAGGKRLLLHFGAVDWEAVVLINGKEIGKHQGGYDPFDLDITDALKPGENELTVSVWDSTGKNGSPHGKQELSAIKKPGGIMYTPCSGIWQTVWLEPVGARHIDRLVIAPDLEGRQVKIHADVNDFPPGGMLKVEALLDGQIVSAASRIGPDITLKFDAVKSWSSEQPTLYDLHIALLDANSAKTNTGRPNLQVDGVESYFGFRTIEVGKDAMGITRAILNGKAIFMAGPLDQGFWPDGIYTAPTDEALKYDIEITKKLGFNTTRKHTKVEPDRWYYWCDKLGLIVWQDMPTGSPGQGGNKDHDGVAVSPEANKQFETELKAMIDTHRNHPSIVMWVVFNEGWGQYDTVRLTKWTKELDPTRLVSNASGWNDRKVGDIIDMHNYPGPGSPKPEETRAAVLGEFGGLGLPVEGHKWVKETWGYRNMSGTKALNRKYIDLWRGVWKLKDDPGLCAAIYTQLTDVETESNGLLSYDRKVIKVDVDTASAAVALGKFPPPPTFTTVVNTAETNPVVWRYTFEKPAAEWFKPEFDATSWKEGAGGFGRQASKAGIVRTEWKTDDIWLRQEVTLPNAAPSDLQLRMYHDDDVEVYFNGVLATKLPGYIDDYELTDIAPAAIAALKPGRNVIAVHCHQTKGGQYIDLGLVREESAKP